MNPINKLPCEGKACYTFDGTATVTIAEIQKSNDTSCPAPTGAILTEIQKEVDEYTAFWKSLFENAGSPSGNCKSPCLCTPTEPARQINQDFTMHLKVHVKKCLYVVVILFQATGVSRKGVCGKPEIKEPPLGIFIG